MRGTVQRPRLMELHVPLLLAEFRGGPLDDQVHLVPMPDTDTEVGVLEIVVDADGIQVCCYEWTDISGGGGVVYKFAGFKAS